MLDSLDTADCPQLVESLFDRAAPWTLVIVTTRPEIAALCDTTVDWT
jgi:hypothetical protein